MAAHANSCRKTLQIVVCLTMAIIPVACSHRSQVLLEAQRLEQAEKWQDSLALYSRAASEISFKRKTEQSELQSHIGHCLIALGRGTDALASLEKALDLDANNVNAHLWMAQLFVAAGVPQRAEPHIAYVASVGPNNLDMLQIRAAMFASEGQYESAERDLDRALQLHENSESIAEQLAQLYLDEGKLDQARGVLNEASQQNPASFQILLALARLDEAQGEASKAEAEYRRAVKLHDTPENNQRLAQFLARNGRVAEAAPILRRADEMLSNTVPAAADLEFQSGHSREALQDYEARYARLSGQEPRLETKSAMRRALATRILEADLALASENDRFALPGARRQLNLAAGGLESHTRSVLNAEIDLQAEDLVLAEQQARSALDDPKTAAQAHYLLGDIAARRGRDEEADQHWHSAIKSNPSYVPARIALANSALTAGDAQKAEEIILDVVRNEPANVDALLVYARALALQRRYDAARALCQRVWAANPQSAEAPILLGEIALDRHQYVVALVEYEKAMLLAPYSERAIVGLTNVYAESGADRMLIGKLERLAESGIPSSRLMEIAGRLYERGHNYPKAIRCLRRAAAMDPKRRSAQIALARTYAEMDRNQDAQALLIDPESTGFAADESRSPLFNALRAEKSGEQTEAVRQYEAAVRAGDPSGIASNNLAWIYAIEGRQLDRAEQLAQHALEVNPGSPQALDTLGMIQFQNRQFTRAVASFQSGLQQASQLGGMEAVRVAIQSHLSAALQAEGSDTVQ